MAFTSYQGPLKLLLSYMKPENCSDSIYLSLLMDIAALKGTQCYIVNQTRKTIVLKY